MTFHDSLLLAPALSPTLRAESGPLISALVAIALRLPSADVAHVLVVGRTGSGKTDFPLRWVGRVGSAEDARVASGVAGANNCRRSSLVRRPN